MASQEALTGTAGRTATVTLRRGRLRIVLVGFIIVMLGSFSLLFLSLTTGSVGIDRSDPTSVVRGFLQAVMVDRNAVQAQTYMCNQWQASDAIQQMKYSDDPGVVTVFGVTSISQNGDDAEADVTLHFIFQTQNDYRYWRLQLAKASDGWRVCSAQMDPSLAPK